VLAVYHGHGRAAHRPAAVSHRAGRALRETRWQRSGEPARVRQLLGEARGECQRPGLGPRPGRVCPAQRRGLLDHSPIAGQIGRTQLQVGNLINQDQTTLTTIVSIDPIFVYFNVDEPTLVRMMAHARESARELSTQASETVVSVGLVNDVGRTYPHQSRVDFLSNQLRPPSPCEGGSMIPTPKTQQPHGRRCFAPGCSPASGCR
jgi:hypothetical protein